MSNAYDAIWDAKNEDERRAALAAYRKDRISDFLCEVDFDLNVVRLAIEEAKSAEGRLVLEWVSAIPHKDREWGASRRACLS